MAFPSKGRKQHDPEMLQPYSPGDFGDDQVHVPRRNNAGFLFRVDPQPGGRVVILVLSAIEPDWDYAFHNAGHLLAAPPTKPRQLHVEIRPAAHFRFSLRANPTKKVHALPPDSRRTEPLTKNGRRVPIPATEEALRGWLAGRADRAGFRLIGDPSVQPGFVYVSKTREPAQGHRLRSVLYEGILEVTDADAFAHTLASGIGPAKAFGFGLLSVAPIRG